MSKEAKKSAFSFEGFVVTESHIVRNPKDQGKLKIDISPSGEFNKSDNKFYLTLDIKLHDDNHAFEIIVKTQGSFKFKEKVDEDHLPNYLYLNAPAIVFPYIRSYISALTALSGLETITIPSMNLTSICDTLKGNTKTTD